jgi:hypothetical protein
MCVASCPSQGGFLAAGHNPHSGAIFPDRGVSVQAKGAERRPAKTLRRAHPLGPTTPLPLATRASSDGRRRRRGPRVRPKGAAAPMGQSREALLSPRGH